MPQMMPLLWLMNLIYSTLMLNLYIIMTHYVLHPYKLNLTQTKIFNMKINYKW